MSSHLNAIYGATAFNHGVERVISWGTVSSSFVGKTTSLVMTMSIKRTQMRRTATLRIKQFTEKTQKKLTTEGQMFAKQRNVIHIRNNHTLYRRQSAFCFFFRCLLGRSLGTWRLHRSSKYDCFRYRFLLGNGKLISESMDHHNENGVFQDDQPHPSSASEPSVTNPFIDQTDTQPLLDSEPTLQSPEYPLESDPHLNGG